MPDESHEPETIRWRAWPCPACRGETTLFDFLLGRHEAGGEIPSCSESELIDELTKRERQWLLDWVATCPHTSEYTSELRKLDEGSEHIVYFAPGDLAQSDVLKATKPGLYGDEYYLENGRVHQRCSTPANYLLRLALIESHFGFAPQPIAITSEGQILSKQKFIQGAPPKQEEVDSFLIEAGLEPVKQNCWLWKKANEGAELEYWIGDARADNFVKTEQGLVPIDLRMWGVVVGEG